MQVEDEEDQTKEALDGRALTKCFIRPTSAAGRSVFFSATSRCYTILLEAFIGTILLALSR